MADLHRFTKSGGGFATAVRAGVGLWRMVECTGPALLAALCGWMAYDAGQADIPAGASPLRLPVQLGLCGVMALLSLRLGRRVARLSARLDAALIMAAHYKLVTENVSDLMLHVGDDNILHYVSPSITDVMGYKPQDLAGSSWLLIVHADDRLRLRDTLESVREDRNQRTTEYRSYCQDGSERWLEAHVRPIRTDGPSSDRGVLINARDVTRRKQSEAQLAQMATTDALTGLANRRQFDSVLDREWRRGIREQQPISLLLLDADGFKLYNDHYGHQRGDALLRAIARCVADAPRRAADFVARYGGEEFAAILPATEIAGAMLLAEQMRKAVADLCEPHDGTAAGIATVSIGVACMLPTQGSLPAALVRAADEALYAAKRNGRNRTARAETYPLPAYNSVPGFKR